MDWRLLSVGLSQNLCRIFISLYDASIDPSRESTDHGFSKRNRRRGVYRTAWGCFGKSVLRGEQAQVEAEQARIKATRQAYVLASRYNRERLYEEVWSEPVIVVAKKNGFCWTREDLQEAEYSAVQLGLLGKESCGQACWKASASASLREIGLNSTMLREDITGIVCRKFGLAV